ncbi:MAG: vitamin B12-dependent ribonucleotide reductase [Thermovirga sp.]
MDIADKPRGVELPLSDNAARVLKERYLLKNEDGAVIEKPDEMFWRVARFVAASEETPADDTIVKMFHDIMARLDFLPNSPTLMNAGRQGGQLAACFVLPVEDSMSGIFDSLKHMALIHKSGGGTGYNFSKLRPKGDAVSSTNGVASGPVSFMSMFDQATEVVMQGGMRRGANMGILDADHPDVFDFIRAKTEEGKLRNFNISVGASEKFMWAVENDEDWDLLNPRTHEIVRTVRARELFDLICEMAWKTGDPGMIFLDKINKDNALAHLGAITSTNPCGEQPLLPYEACNLGSINLANMISGSEVNWEKLRLTTRLAVRFLDNVIDVNQYPLPQIEEMVKKTRKIGLGVMGWADMLFRLRIPYDSDDALDLAGRVMSLITDTGRQESTELARTRGECPALPGSGMRNATITTIAPTGSLSMIADCSSGIEPVFALEFTKEVLEGKQFSYRNRYYAEALERGESPAVVKRVFKTSHEIAPEWHVKMQSAFQEHVDNAVSKTINLPGTATVEDVRKAYTLAWKTLCKGITVFRDGCRTGQVLYIEKTAQQQTLPMPQVSEVDKPMDRPFILGGKTAKIPTSYGNLYLTVNEVNGRPVEVFTTMGKSGHETMAFTEAMGRLISLALRSGVKIHGIIKQMKGIGGSQPVWHDNGVIMSVPDAISYGLMSMGYLDLEEKGMMESLSSTDMCPVCGASMTRQEGCIKCPACGFSRC